MSRLSSETFPGFIQDLGILDSETYGECVMCLDLLLSTLAILRGPKGIQGPHLPSWIWSANGICVGSHIWVVLGKRPFSS